MNMVNGKLGFLVAAVVQTKKVQSFRAQKREYLNSKWGNKNDLSSLGFVVIFK